MSINSWLEDELYQQYLHDHSAVDDKWIQTPRELCPLKSFFGGGTACTSASMAPACCLMALMNRSMSLIAVTEAAM